MQDNFRTTEKPCHHVPSCLVTFLPRREGKGSLIFRVCLSPPPLGCPLRTFRGSCKGPWAKSSRTASGCAGCLYNAVSVHQRLYACQDFDTALGLSWAGSHARESFLTQLPDSSFSCTCPQRLARCLMLPAACSVHAGQIPPPVSPPACWSICQEQSLQNGQEAQCPAGEGAP